MSVPKADLYGNPAQVARAESGWVSPAQLRHVARGTLAPHRDQRCAACRHSYTDANGVAGRRVSLRCVRITFRRDGERADTATLSTAWCPGWEAIPKRGVVAAGAPI